MRTKRYKRVSWLPAVWLGLVLLLAACGQTPTAPSLNPTPRPGLQDTLSAVEALRATATPAPARTEVTATVVVAPTPTTVPQPPITSAQTEAPPVSPGSVAQPSATPTLKGTPEKVDRFSELRILKNAYDALVRHLYKEVDSVGLLTIGLEELSRITGIPAPSPIFGQDADKNWEIYSAAFSKMLDDAKDFRYPKNQIAYRIVNVMAESIGDEHTYFLEASGYQNRQDLLSGNNSSVGYGVIVTPQDNKAYITRVVSGGPADKVGIKPGDQLLQYDDLKIDAKNWAAIRDAKENETHRFTLARMTDARPIVVNITKRRYNLPTVEFQLLNGHIGYIAIRDFFMNVADETDRAMTELRKQGADSWVLDVRENPGGVNAELVIGRFVSNGEVTGYTIDRRRRDPVKVSSDLISGLNKGKPFSPQLPLVLLMNEGSASSSEILALAIRDFQLGPLIGVKTSGALGHTSAFPLGDGTAISVTVDVYESRNGLRLNGVGVSPDIEIKMSVQDLVTGRDPQLKAGMDYLEKVLAKKQP